MLAIDKTKNVKWFHPVRDYKSLDPFDTNKQYEANEHNKSYQANEHTKAYQANEHNMAYETKTSMDENHVYSSSPGQLNGINKSYLKDFFY